MGKLSIQRRVFVLAVVACELLAFLPLWVAFDFEDSFLARDSFFLYSTYPLLAFGLIVPFLPSRFRLFCLVPVLAVFLLSIAYIGDIGDKNMTAVYPLFLSVVLGFEIVFFQGKAARLVSRDV